ncbi:MAG TPA: DUF5953 family protein [Myxococcaceae bacterium]
MLPRSGLNKIYRARPYQKEVHARAIGSPDPARDAERLSRARRTASGGWVVQLTEAPFDLQSDIVGGSERRSFFPEKAT